MDKTSDMFRVGVVSSTHGIKGEVKVYPFLPPYII